MLTLDLSYDLPSGLYLSGSSFGSLPARGEPGLLGLAGVLGYARRLSAGVSADGGVSRWDYVGMGRSGHHTGYTEAYLGLATRRLSAHVHYSPDYFSPGSRTLYGEVEGNIGAPADIRLSAHLGMLGYLDSAAYRPAMAPRFDWRIGASRQFGAVDVRATLSGGRPGPQVYDGPPRPRTQFTVGAGYTF